MKCWAYLLAGVALCSVAVAEEDIASRMINKETNGAWYFQPEKPKAKHIKADVPGGLRIPRQGDQEQRIPGTCRRARRSPAQSMKAT